MRRLILLLAGAVLLASCGSGGDGDTGGSSDDDADTPATTSSAPTTSPSPTPTTAPPLAWGPTQDEYDQAAAIVADLPVERQAGQVIVARYAGLEPPVERIADLGLGGVILMGDNVESPQQVTDATAAIQEAGGDRGYPVIVGIDQEGGTVARITEPATEFPAYMTLGASRDTELAAQVAQASGEELRAMGLTMVFAPDADVTTGADDPTIGTRSASSDPQVVAETVQASLRGYAESGIVAVPKHFPGHGSVPADSHEELPVQTSSLDELRARDFVPFQAAVEAGAEAIMVAHIDVEAVDPGVPSSLSPEVIGLLRDELGFEGAVVTDAQDMAAISDGYGSGAAAVRALAAGADIVLMPADVEAAHTAIVDAVASGELPADRLAEAATRGVALMLHEAAGPAPDAAAVGSHEDLSYAESLGGVTVVAGACAGPLVDGVIRVVGGEEADRVRFDEAAAAAGLTTDAGAPTTVRLLGGTEPGSGDVVVALDRPYALGASDAPVKIALYGRTPGAFRALAEVLAGTSPARGTLPVPVDGAEQQGCPG
ncbi:glycoside hydrolase family 3 protein [Jiangella alkaliphila]|uniref:beta-N-acetylhexosaminidase n=1 Tax=Jiangella alkaliphila TaxID=419479 RepID=A0A1H2M6I2_9ACTN|nr:glycoside hydrolase family 3 N-terminal domain-containing protein [Jiangella alkaliphila]SDU88625.1 beta-N-acetylhexosaminidase [Jiangella alkaliphila]